MQYGVESSFSQNSGTKFFLLLFVEPRFPFLRQKIQNVIDEVKSSLTSIALYSDDAIQLVQNAQTDLRVICPLVNSTDLESIIGVDINDIIETIVEQQYVLREDITTDLSSRQSFVDGLQNRLMTIEDSIEESEPYIWILPGLLLIVSSLTLVSMGGVVLAWREKSGVRFQQVMSYVVLPLLIIVAIMCWVMVMILSFSTMVGTDVCLSGSSSGSPDETIQEIFAVLGSGANANGTSYEVATTYVNQCRGIDPTRDIHEIKLETQDHIDEIWRQISKIDSVGRANVIKKCGESDEFLDMLTGARDLAITLTNIRRSLSRLADSIECESIHPIYTQAAHDMICTQTLSASSYGFVTFLIMWCCLMAMISLRSSWLGNIEEEKVYHDETDVAENMVLDEHEEYLAYISRYKHEWQEYEGIEEEGAVRSTPRKNNMAGFSNRSPPPTTGRTRDCWHYFYGNEEEGAPDASESDLSTLDSSRNIYLEEAPRNQEPTIYLQPPPGASGRSHTGANHQDEGVSYASAEISFASFSSDNNDDASRRYRDILTLSPDRPPPRNPESLESLVNNNTTSLFFPNDPNDPDFRCKVCSSPAPQPTAPPATEPTQQQQQQQQTVEHHIDLLASTATDSEDDTIVFDTASDFDPSFDLHSTGEVEVQL